MKKISIGLKLFALMLLACALSFVFVIAGCGGDEDGDEEPEVYSLEFTDQVSKWEKVTKSRTSVGASTTCWYATAVYCQYPTYLGQSVDIYVPEAYIKDDGVTIDETAAVAGYTAETAPIIYWNSHGSYVGMGPFDISGTQTRSTQYGWVINMINNGFVVVEVGERGKTTTDDDGNVIGRGPIAISDLKAGVRFLKHNDDVIPGNTERIISVGTSSGGSMSALLGTSGNNSYFDKYLEEMGACMDETDDVYATMAYCPITDLSHADFAYEWMFGVDRETIELTDFQCALSDLFMPEYASYINSLGLTDDEGNPLTLAEDGSKSGTYYDWLVTKYEESFENYVADFDEGYKDFATGVVGDGGASEADEFDWLSYDSSTGKASLTPTDGTPALDALVLDGYALRQKACPSFDQLRMIGTDNEVFGEQGTKANSERSARHHNQTVAEMIGSLKDDFPDEYEEYYQDYYDQSHEEEVVEWSKYINSYTYLTGEESSDVSPHFRVNMGAKDADTSITVSATLAKLLEKNDIDVEFNIMWAWGHNDVDTPTGLMDWVNSIM